MYDSDTLFRGIIDFRPEVENPKYQLDDKDLEDNIQYLLDKEVVFPNPSETKLFTLIAEFFAKNDTVPSYSYLKEHFTLHEGNEVIIAKLDTIHGVRPYLGNEYKVIVDTYIDRELADELGKVFQDAYRIATTGLTVGQGRWKKEYLGLEACFEYCDEHIQVIKGKLSEGVKASMDKDIAKPVEAMDWLIQSYMARKQTSTFAGAPGTCKTISQVHEAKILTTGGSLYNDQFFVDKPLRVIYFEADLSDSEFDSYLKKVGLSYHNSPNFKAMTYDRVNEAYYRKTGKFFSLLDKKCVKILEDYIEEFKADVLILDSIASFVGVTGKDKSKSSDMGPLLMTLKQIASKHNIHVRTLHHMRKANQDRKSIRKELSDMMGTDDFASLTNYVLAISNVVDDCGKIKDRAGVIHAIKEGSLGGMVKFQDINFVLINDTENSIHFEYTIEDIKEEDTKRESYKKDILFLLYEKGKLSKGEITENFAKKIVPRTLYGYIIDLKDLKLIDTEGSTKLNTYRYYITTAGLRVIGKDTMDLFPVEPTITASASESIVIPEAQTTTIVQPIIPEPPIPEPPIPEPVNQDMEIDISDLLGDVT